MKRVEGDADWMRPHSGVWGCYCVTMATAGARAVRAFRVLHVDDRRIDWAVNSSQLLQRFSTSKMPMSGKKISMGGERRVHEGAKNN